MVTVLHAFDEKTEAARHRHLSEWHGIVRAIDLDDDNEENPIVCYCGGRRYDMSPTVCVVWHTLQVFETDD
jgi:hypothetical protein